MIDPDEEAMRFAYGWDGQMDPHEYVKLYYENKAERIAYLRLPWYKRLWEQLRGRKPKPWVGV